MLNLALCKAGNIDRSFGRDEWTACMSENWTTTLEIDSYVFIDVKRVLEDVRPRMNLYAKGLMRIEEKSSVLGGKPVFSGTRLSVHHVGKMFARGEPLDNILEDYSYLTKNDVLFAHLYHLAHPTVGRPRAIVEVDPEDVGSEFPSR
jgi:uncharacterized protein (DUF433 family)